ncbi:MAG: hypothetical protein ACREBU_20200, partial [Nitrososphaera sp.]
MFAGIKEKLTKLEEQVRTAYKNFSIVGHVCTLQSVPPDQEPGEFRQFASNILIEIAHILDPNHFLILSEIGTSVARDEKNFLVKHLTQEAPKQTVDEISLDSVINIVRSIRQYGHTPNHIFLPIEFHGTLFDWNKDKHLQYNSTTNIFN